MRPRLLALLGVVALGGLASGAAVAWKARQRRAVVVQPMAFNHKRHLAEDMKCLDCHKGADKQAQAGAPTVKQCMLCHEEAKGTHPDEPKVREYAARGEAIPWIQVNRLGHDAYFSHVAHVNFAKMDCAECHGDMKDQTEPVTRPQITQLDMDRCMRCHKEKGASNDCLRCHQ